MSDDLQKQMDEGYAYAYRLFLRHRQFKREKSVNAVVQNLDNALASSQQIAILSIGPGSGDVDMQVVEAIRAQMTEGQTLRYVGLEPNYIHRQEFQERAQSANFPNVVFEILPTKIEDFKPTEKFDAVYFNHSIYHMTGFEKDSIEWALDWTTNEGFVAITVDNAAGKMYAMIQEYTRMTGDQGYWAEFAIPNADLLAALFEKMGLPYTRESYAEDLDVTICLDEASAEGQLLLGFLYQTDLRNRPAELVNQLRTVMRQFTEEDNGQLILRELTSTLVVRKP